jgi:hypothetical protein
LSRSFAQIHLAIWADEDFRNLEPGPQRLYLFLISQPDLNYAGVVGLNPRRWVSRAKGYTLDQLDAELAVLIERRYVLVDTGEEELLVRSFIRNDGTWKNPKTVKSARRDALATGSRRLRQALITELERLPLDELPDKTRETITTETKDLIGRLSESIATPSLPHSDGVDTGSLGHRDGSVVVAVVGGVVPVVDPSLVPKDAATPPSPPREKSDRGEPPPREDVERLCSTLAERLAANGFLERDTKISKGWRDEARRLFDIDKVPLVEALRVLDWCQQDTFWRGNIQSLPTFRKKYSGLRDKARTAGWLRQHEAGSYYDSVVETTGAWEQ